MSVSGLAVRESRTALSLGWGEIVERCIHVPATEARDACCFVSRRDDGLVEGGVGRMFERYDFKALVIELCAIADELNLRNTRDSLEVWMQDGLVGLFSLVIPMPV
jgi:hypothetical protein